MLNPQRTGNAAQTRVVAIILSPLLLVAAVACGDDGSDAATTSPETDPAATNDDDLGAFCDEIERLGGERPEAYVGSAEHVEDIGALLAVSSAEIRGDVETFRDFLASGGVDPDDPDTNLTENFPAEVQGAISRVVAYGDEHCGE